jgi:hypothetical protein
MSRLRDSVSQVVQKLLEAVRRAGLVQPTQLAVGVIGNLQPLRSDSRTRMLPIAPGSFGPPRGVKHECTNGRARLFLL